MRDGHIYISDEIDEERIPFQTRDKFALGKAHYSWKLISNLYIASLKKIGLDVVRLTRPEIYQHPIAKSTIRAREDAIHLAVKPIEHLRPLPSSYNVFVCGWEFSEITAADDGSSPFTNQKQMLSTADLVICWTDFTASTLKIAGISNVLTLPPHIPFVAPDLDDSLFARTFCVSLDSTGGNKLARVKPLSEFLSDANGARLFFTVLNPHDKRKQFPKLISEFCQAQREGADCRLIVKVIVDNTTTNVHNINDILRIHYGVSYECDDVVFIGDEFTPEEMSKLYRVADFYLCTSSAEGLNLPLVEALQQQCVAVTTLNTAMGSYLSSDDVVEVHCCETKAEPGMNSLSHMSDFTHYPPVEGAIAQAVHRALALSEADYDALKQRAKMRVDEEFGIEKFRGRWNNLFNDVGEFT